MANRKLLLLECIGALFIIISGTLLHFTYEWLGFWKPGALIAAVNESTWEHLKLAFWPAFIFYIFEWLFMGRNDTNFITAKAVSLFIMPASIIVLFYTYTGILGYNFLAADISTFVIAVLFGQYVSYRMLRGGRVNKRLIYFSVPLIAVLLFLFSTFTWYPPHIPVFSDPVSGGYGIMK